jgi:threonine dehydrogenase-like Zn-dependent dehydrogenase
MYDFENSKRSALNPPMRALVIRRPGEAVVESVAEPEAQPGQVLLRVRMVGMCGSDLNSYRGKNPLVRFPRIPGHEIAATILQAHESRPELMAGRHVTLSPYTSCEKCASCLRGRSNACQFNETLGVQRDGAMTEQLWVPAEKLYTANLSIRELCLVEPLTVGFHAVARGRVQAGDTVAVFGCGGVGLGAIAASHFAGACTIGVDLDDRKLEIAKSSGANYIVNTTRESLHDRLLSLTEDRGPDVVIEAIGLPETFRAAVEEVAFTGRVVYIGYAKEPVAYETRLFVQKELDILGSRNALPADFARVIQMLESGKFPAEQAVGTIVSLEQAPSILRQWSEAPQRFTKIMVNLD